MGNEVSCVDANLEDNLLLEEEEITKKHKSNDGMISPHFSDEQFLNSSKAKNFKAENQINVISLNTPTSAAAKRKEDAFKYRKKGIKQLVVNYAVDILALQEPHFAETRSFHSIIEDEFDYFGRGRNGDNSSEFQPIFWRKNKFEFIESGVFWHSEHSSDHSIIGWDAACIRHSVWVKLEHKNTKKKIMIINTHWDHRGAVSRSQTSLLYHSILPKLRLWNDQKLPIIICGDFNDLLRSPSIQLLINSMNSNYDHYLCPLTQFDYPTSIYGVKFLSSPKTASYVGFFNQFSSIIDYIFYDGDELFCSQYAVIEDTFISGRNISDHRPIFASFCVANDDN